jgi:hypothetical protein
MFMAWTTLAVIAGLKTDSKDSRRCGGLQMWLAFYGIGHVGTSARDCGFRLLLHRETSLVEGSGGAG